MEALDANYDFRFKPLPTVSDQVYDRDWRVEGVCGQTRDVIEIGFPWGINDSIAFEGRKPILSFQCNWLNRN